MSTAEPLQLTTSDVSALFEMLNEELARTETHAELFSGSGTHLGLPAFHQFGFVRRLLIPSTSGPYSNGLYSMSVMVTVGGQVLRYRGAAQVDCEDGTFIGVGVRRN